jgi:hypothetical protein
VTTKQKPSDVMLGQLADFNRKSIKARGEFFYFSPREPRVWLGQPQRALMRDDIESIGVIEREDKVETTSGSGIELADALADMPVDYVQALVPSLKAAADRAGVKLKWLADGFYSVEGVPLWSCTTISVRDDGYVVRTGSLLRGRNRWRTLGKWKRPARAVEAAKGQLGEPGFVSIARHHAVTAYRSGAPWTCGCADCDEARAAGWSYVQREGDSYARFQPPAAVDPEQALDAEVLREAQRMQRDRGASVGAAGLVSIGIDEHRPGAATVASHVSDRARRGHITRQFTVFCGGCEAWDQTPTVRDRRAAIVLWWRAGWK